MQTATIIEHFAEKSWKDRKTTLTLLNEIEKMRGRERKRVTTIATIAPTASKPKARKKMNNHAVIQQ